MMHIPWEIIGDIVLYLAESSKSHPLQLAAPQLVRRSLFQLCLASSGLRYFATPLLYSSIRVASEKQLHALLRTLKQDNIAAYAHVKTLILPDYNDSLEQDALDDLADLISLVHSSLRRILFDRSMRLLTSFSDSEEGDSEVAVAIGPPDTTRLHDALELALNIEEFTSMQCELYFDNGHRHNCWPKWTNLVRLALHNPDIDRHFILALVSLEKLAHLAFDNADFEGDGADLEGADADAVAAMPLLLLRKQNMRRVVFSSFQNVQHVFRGTPNPWVAAAKAIRDSNRGGATAVYVQAEEIPDDEWCIENAIEWFGARAADGTLWEMQGIQLASLEMDRPW